MARPKVEDKDLKRVESLRVRVTKSELTAMRNLAEQKKVSLSELIRVSVLGEVKG